MASCIDILGAPLSQVSKGFCTIAYDPELWKALYANARFLRPPGPFPTVSFERAFVQSARLAQSWTTQSLRTISSVSVPFDGWLAGDGHLIGGRWYLVCQKNRRFVLYDMNPDAQTRAPQVLWEQRENITDWKKCLVTSEEGQLIVYVLLSTHDAPRWYVRVILIRGCFLFPKTLVGRFWNFGWMRSRVHCVTLSSSTFPYHVPVTIVTFGSMSNRLQAHRSLPYKAKVWCSTHEPAYSTTSPTPPLHLCV